MFQFILIEADFLGVGRRRAQCDRTGDEGKAQKALPIGTRGHDANSGTERYATGTQAQIKQLVPGWNESGVQKLVVVSHARKGQTTMKLPTIALAIFFATGSTLAVAQGGGSGGGGSAGGGSGGGASAGGAASGPTAGTGSALGSPNAGAAGTGTAGVSGVPNGPANAGGLNNSGNDPSGAGNSAKVPTTPGTNSLGTANPSGSPSAASGASGSTTTGTASNRQDNGGRIDGTVTPGPSMPGDAEIRAEDPKVNAKIRSICKGC